MNPADFIFQYSMIRHTLASAIEINRWNRVNEKLLLPHWQNKSIFENLSFQYAHIFDRSPMKPVKFIFRQFIDHLLSKV